MKNYKYIYIKDDKLYIDLSKINIHNSYIASIINMKNVRIIDVNFCPNSISIKIGISHDLCVT